MKVRFTSIGLLFALLSAFIFVPGGSALAKNDKKAHPFKGVKAHGKVGEATLNVTRFDVNAAGQLVASGTVTSATRGTLGTFENAPVQVQQEPGFCTILTLRIQPIFLDLLGLVVETSEINLVITANENRGLGRLLCAIARLLDPRDVADRLNAVVALNGGKLSSAQPLTGATDVTITHFSNVNGQIYANFVLSGKNGRPLGAFRTAVEVQQVPEIPEGACTVLRLVLEPIDVTILGVRIQLYGATPPDPATGFEGDPVVVNIYGVPGEGNLLGNLVCALFPPMEEALEANRTNEVVWYLNRIVRAAG